MRALFPSYCRALGYLVLIFALSFPLLLFYLNVLTDDNLLLVKVSVKLVLIFGALLMLFAKRNNKTSMSVYREKSIVFGLILTTIYLFADMFLHIISQDLTYTDGSSFLVFLILSNACFEYFTISKR
ncbi:hypothetical protein [Bacteroides propionicifaciens]|jgi:hypothetical protein|uniref:hypothetical protein n=1 Tax=Bacteroides propionicifaciens TaxID=392838 RepID=UPI00036A73FB|nr:hypothetical protein [Bacteroides propionicifaciens]